MTYNIAKKKLKEFGFLIGIAFPIIFGWIFPALRGHSFKIWTICISIPFLILAILRPNLLFYPYKVWMRIGNILGFINSHVILGIIFFIVLQPIALIMKILNHDPLRMKKINQKSYREVRNNYKIDFKKIF